MPRLGDDLWRALALSASLVFVGCPFGGASIDECDVCDAVFCDQNRVATCVCTSASPDGGTDYRIEVTDDCAAASTTCSVLRETRGQRWEDEFEPGAAMCLETCETTGEAECRGEGNEAAWFVCAPAESSTDALQEGVATWVETGAPGAFSGSTPTGWTDAALPCRDCQSSCGCDVDTVCAQNFCLPGDPANDLVCCGRERGEDCPNGAACERADGSAGTCDTAGSCEACESIADCETGSCVPGPQGEPALCMTDGESVQRPRVCHDELDQVWVANACGTLLVVEEDCGEEMHCEAAECVQDAPEIGLGTTLLSFGETPVTTGRDRTLSIGNVGQLPLTVSAIEVDEEDADLFTVSIDEAFIEVDEIVDVTVTFTPTETGTVSARLYIRSDDADEPEVEILMNGEGVE